MNKFKVMKVFDCNDMPDDLANAFFNMWDHLGNDSCMPWTIGDSIYEEGDPSIALETWLLENGGLLNETVLIRY